MVRVVRVRVSVVRVRVVRMRVVRVRVRVSVVRVVRVRVSVVRVTVVRVNVVRVSVVVGQVIKSYLWQGGGTRFPREDPQLGPHRLLVLSSALVRPSLGLCTIIPTFLSSRFINTFLLSFLCLLLPLVSPLLFPCARYLCEFTPRAWDRRSHQSMLNGPLYFEAKWLSGRCVAIDHPHVQHKKNIKIVTSFWSFFHLFHCSIFLISLFLLSASFSCFNPYCVHI